MSGNIIHTHIYDPSAISLFGSNKSDKSEVRQYTCGKTSSCEAYQKGFCVNVCNPFGVKCPQGGWYVTTGYTQRARKFHEQICDWKETYSETYNKLSTAPKRVIKVAEGWMLPYPHINMAADLPFHGQSGFMLNGSPFLKEEDFTKEVFNRILMQRPQALMGGEIGSYQKEVVPKFVIDLYQHYPDKFEEVANDRAREIVKNYNPVGRKAYLKTLKANVSVVISRKTWWWDGEKLSMKGQSEGFAPCSWEACYHEYVPDDKASVKIESLDQVDENTLFAD